MLTPDLDDYNSLTNYAARFVRDYDELIELWLSQRSTLVAIAVREQAIGNEAFSMNSLDYLFSIVDKDELISVKDFVTLTGAVSIIDDNGQIAADDVIFNDFVAYLTAIRINV